jgi:hypothetical protein
LTQKLLSDLFNYRPNQDRDSLLPVPDPVSSRRRRQRGSSPILEGALVFVPFFALFLAIIDYGLVTFVKNTFQHATREGVRYAVTYQIQAGLGHDGSIKEVVKTNALGFLSNGTGPSHIKIRYYDPETLVETTANNPGNIIEISIENYQWGIIAPLLRSANPVTLNVRSSDRMETVPDGLAPPAR